MRRGDLVTTAAQGDFGKPRPALVIQSDLYSEHPSVTVLPLSTTLINAPLFRVSIVPDIHNKLSQSSEVMVDKIWTVKREKVGEVFGHVSEEDMLSVSRSLAVFLGVV